MPLETQHFYEFKNFRLDPVERVLLRDGAPVYLTPKAYQLLKILVENHGHIVDKEKLISEIWAGSFVEEGNLAVSATAVRKALDDNASNPTFIETVPRRGYRFIADVREVEASERSVTAEEETPARQLNGKVAASEEVKHPVNRSESKRAGAVVALADWRHDSSAPDEETQELRSEKMKRHVPAFELVRAAPLVEKNRRSHFYILAGLIAVVGLASLGYGLYRFASTKDTGTFSLAKATRLTSNGKATFAALSPDGKFVAYIVDGGDHQSIRLKNIATGSDVEVVPDEPTALGSLTFSPDGNYLYYYAKGKLYQLPFLGGTPKKVLEPYSGLQHNRISFSPDGKQFAFVRSSRGNHESPGIFIADADGGNERILASGTQLGALLWSAAWSPDGRTIACAAEKSDGRYEVIFVRVADGVVLPVPSRRWIRVIEVIWQSNGDELLVIASDRHHNFRLWELAYPTGEARKLTGDSHNYQSISLAADGRSMAAARAEQESHIWVMPADDTSQARPLTDGFEKYDGVFSIGWAPGGKLIYEAIPDDKGEFFSIDVSGGGSKQIASDVLYTAASPDGNYLVFAHDDADGEGLFRLNVADGERKRLTTGKEMWPTFSPDARWVIFNRFGDEPAVWKVSIDGGEAIKLTNNLGLPVSPTISPDGRLIALYRGRTGAMSHRQLSIIPFEGGEIVKAFNMPNSTWEVYVGKAPVQWSPNGQSVSYVVHRDGVSNVWRQSMDGGDPVQVTNFTSGLIFNFAYSPDGKQLALSRGTVSRDVILINKSE